ncbi:MAG: flagellar basal body P-ring protein FlgI [Candidatus Hydrogenedentota bacterium]
MACAFLSAALIVPSAHGSRIKDLCVVQGAQENALTGVGLVVGLAGTGDGNQDALRRQQRLLERLEIDVDQVAGLNSDNIAVVVVDAMYPPFAKQGTRIDVRVNALYDCESLKGGTLLQTMLYGIDGEVYAIAQGPLSLGGFSAGQGGTGVAQNHVTVARIPMGATIEREIPSTITDGERVTLQLKRPDFITAHKIQMAINDEFQEEAASALGPGTINVRIPTDRQHDLVSFMAAVQNIHVEPDFPARVVINERTGTLVIGGEVIVRPCQVAHGNLTIEVATTPVVSQPAPLSEGETVTAEVADVEVTQEEGYLMPVQGTSANDVAMALNALKVTPRDMISIFQALREAGALDADVEIM